MNNQFPRTDRIKEAIKKNIAIIIKKKIRDPRIVFVTITDVDLTADYSLAIIYYTVLEEDKKLIIKQALDNATGFLRKELGSHLQIYKIPKLKFKYDISIDKNMNLAKLIDQISKKEIK